MLAKLQQLEKKLRIAEQQRRDMNQVPNLDLQELELARTTLELKETELVEKRQTISALSAELSEVKTELNHASSKIDIMSRRIEELVKSEDQLSDQLDQLERDGMDSNRRIRELEEEVVDLTGSLSQERENYKDLKSQYQSDKKEYESKIDILNTRLDDMRKVVQKTLQEKETVLVESQKKVTTLLRDYERALTEKEQSNRDKEHLLHALQNSAQAIQDLIHASEEEEKRTLSRIGKVEKEASWISGELRVVANSIHKIIVDAEAKLKASEQRLKDQRKLAEEVAQKHAEELSSIQQEVERLQRMMNEQTAHIAELTRERISLQQDAERDRERIRELKKELADALSTQGKYNEEDLQKAREQEKEIWMEKITQMRKEDEAVRSELDRIKDQLVNSQIDFRSMRRERDDIIKQMEEERKQKMEQIFQLNKSYENICMLVEDDRMNIVNEAIQNQKKFEHEKEELSTTIHDLNESLSQTEVSLSNERNCILDLRDRFPPVQRYLDGEPEPEPEPTPVVVVEEPMRLASRSMSMVPISTRSFGAQTDPVPETTTRGPSTPLRELPLDLSLNRVEDIVRQSIVTNNYFFDKGTGDFSNSYPVEEGFLRDLIRAFYTMSSSVTTLVQTARKLGYNTAAGLTNDADILKQNKEENNIPAAIESFLLTTAQDLVIKLEKSKEDLVNRLRAEHVDQMTEKVQETIDQLTTQHNHTIYELNEEHTKEKATIERDCDIKVSKMTIRIHDLEVLHREEAERLKLDHEVEMKKLRDEFEAAMEEVAEEEQELYDNFGTNNTTLPPTSANALVKPSTAGGGTTEYEGKRRTSIRNSKAAGNGSDDGSRALSEGIDDNKVVDFGDLTYIGEMILLH
eukprot:scaffold96_cov167-Ochromonas_danica.AAC.34